MSSNNLKTKVYSQEGQEVKELELNPKIFAVTPKESVLHQVAVAQMANSRQPIAHTKLKSEVRGGGKKPWRQKGTGRARHGSSRSPIWVGGGIIFGPRNIRNFSQKVNKKMKTKALLMCFSDKLNHNVLTILDNLNLSQGKTNELIKIIKNLKTVLALTTKSEKNINKSFDIKKHKLSLLIIIDKSDKIIFNAGSNLMNLKITTADSLNVLDLLKYEKVLMTEACLAVMEKTYLK
ncbi:MAG TPA: 50S ribosomal protein L4 [bacterium]|nr:50S ribosomal protein L4 [bacterium]